MPAGAVPAKCGINGRQCQQPTRSNLPAPLLSALRTFVPPSDRSVRVPSVDGPAIVGREVRQTLLIHASALNAAMLDRLASMFRARGYRFISLERALEDPAYRHRDGYYGPAGITWLHRWAITDGKPGTIFAGEPSVPAWIEQAAR